MKKPRSLTTPRSRRDPVRRNEDIVLTIIRERGSKGDFELVERWHAEFVRAQADPHEAMGDVQSVADLKELLA